MGWTIDIGPSVTIDAHSRFSFRRLPHYKDDGTAEYVETIIEAEGKIIDTSAANVAADALTFDTELIGDLSYKTVVIALNGTPWQTFAPGTSIDGPRVDTLELLPDKGAGDSHWPYRIVICVKETATGDNGFDLEASLATFRNVKGVVTKKIWRAASGGKKLSDAVAAVLALAPGGDVEFEDQNFYTPTIRYAAAWTWEAGRTLSAPQVFEDPIHYAGLGDDYITDPQAAAPEATTAANPKLHLLLRTGCVIRVSGYVEGMEDDLSPFVPDPHFTESSDLVRARAREGRYRTALDPQRAALGVYRLPYEEFWIFTGDPDSPPEPNHGTHLAAESSSVAGGVAPGDGPMAALGN